LSLKERYESLCGDESDIHEHLATFVDLVVSMNAQKVIELGVRTGVSTVAWLYGLEQTGGHLWSVDIVKSPFDAKGWTFILGDDLSVDVLEQLPDDADIVFIDSSHTYGHTLGELAVYSRKMRPGGRIVLHDTEVQHPDSCPAVPAFPVKTAIIEFCEDEGLAWTNVDNCYGLAVIELTA
jgi:cephalosporin hydroxylase